MHAAIFLGFMSLLLRKLQLIAIGYRETATFPDVLGSFVNLDVLGPFAALKDTIEIVVVLAVLYAFYRRFVVQAAAARAQPRGGARAVADPGDHGDRLRLRRLPVRAAVGSRCRASGTSAPGPTPATRWRTRSRGCRRGVEGGLRC